MNKFITAAALLAALLLASPARASASLTDLSDLWWNPDESGWGMQITHRGNVIFVTMYAYDTQGKPTWSTAVLRAVGADWTGDVYLTTGPYYGAGKFDPATVTRRVAGTMTWSSPDARTGTITYSIDGVSVTKKVVRQTLENDNYSGRYLGALSWVNSCSGMHENPVDITVTQVGINVTVNWSNQTTRDACSFSGELGSDGQFGAISGNFQCAPVHDDGEFNFFQMRVTPESITGRYNSRDEDSRCSSDGYLSASRRR